MLTKSVLLLYGTLLIAGGGMGYSKDESLASLLWGVISGVAVLGGFALSMKRPKLGIAIGIVVALVVAIRMSIRLYETNKFMPAGMVVALSVLALVLLSRGLWRQLKTPRTTKASAKAPSKSSESS